MMTSTEIKESLKPMFQFAPGLIRCAEIVAAAEEAEASMKPREKRKAELEKQVAELEARVGSTQAQVSKEKTDFNAFMARQEAQRDEARVQTQKVADAVSAMQLKLLNLNSEYEAKRKEKDVELAGVEAVRDKIKAEIEALKKKFAA